MQPPSTVADSNVTYDLDRVRRFLRELFAKIDPKTGAPEGEGIRLGAQRTYIFDSPLVPFGTIGTGIPIKFRVPVVALGLVGQVDQATDVSYAQMKMRCQFGSQEDAWDDGYGQGQFAGMLMLFGRFNKPFYDFVRPRFARQSITYTATFSNVSTSVDATPTAGVRVIELDPETVPENT